ncbi:MAG: carbon-nitrogen hydrolase family protein [Bacilli bacterium]|jgi:nitrilase|nr:carbon-nitrogen hydrolase family protein [Bacilli bacterium]
MDFLENNVKVAVVQAAPVLFNLEKTITKLRTLAQEAAAQQAKIVVFPESFIPCYPRGLSFGFIVGSRSEEGRQDWLRYNQNSLDIHSKEAQSLADLALELNIYLSVGVTEKEALTGTLYCTNLVYSPQGQLVSHHRKLKPTGSERCIWGEGDETYLDVVASEYGRIGALICWENYMPLARAKLYQEGVSIYLAPTADSRDMWQNTIKHIGMEGRCFVLSCNQFINKDMYPNDLKTYAELDNCPEIMARGGSAIIDPYGNYLAGPLFDKEGIIYADLDLQQVIAARFDFDPFGHYSRPDVLALVEDNNE